MHRSFSPNRSIWLAVAEAINLAAAPGSLGLVRRAEAALDG